MTSSLVKINIGLDSQIINTVPKVLIKINDDIIHDLNIDQTKSVLIERDLPAGKHRLEISFYNKNHKESDYSKEMAVLIKHIKFQHIDQDLHYLSKYFPDYPEHFIKEQKQQGKEWPESILSNHLGWNGKYIIEFETPIYLWIHKKLNLGWLIK